VQSPNKQPACLVLPSTLDICMHCMHFCIVPQNVHTKAVTSFFSCEFEQEKFLNTGPISFNRI
jgi:hypothetical protein